MKKLFAFLALLGMLSFSSGKMVFAQNDEQESDTTEVVDTTEVAEEDTLAAAEEDAAGTMEAEEEEKEEKKTSMHQVVKDQFIQGGAGFMSLVLIALILGLALAIERIIYLNFATTNTKKLLAKIEAALESGGVSAAKDICRDTRGPVASIFYQGLERAEKGMSLEEVEKSIVAYGGVQMGLLEKGLSWISLFISIAPMLGFMGTVIGMIDAFGKIQVAGEARPDEVAVGIKIALITTVSGLIVAIILQFFYNYIISKIDGIVNRMEDASIQLMDLLIKYQDKK